MFRYLLPILKIYSIRNVQYRFSTDSEYRNAVIDNHISSAK